VLTRGRLAERDTGVEGGGMDQAISMLAQRGMGKLIHFHPLSAADVRLPPGCVLPSAAVRAAVPTT
jgi:galactokinase